MNSSVVVIGATGDVGDGIVRQSLSRGWDVTAVGRSLERLDELAERVDSPDLHVVQGSLATSDSADSLAETLDLPSFTAVIVSISAAWDPRPALAVTPATAERHFADYLYPQILAATTCVPQMSTGAVFVSVGGGLADFPARGMSVVSMAQAAQRMWCRHLEREALKDHGVLVREVMIHAMVTGYRHTGPVPVGGMTGAEVGAGVCDVVAVPGSTDGPIVALRPHP